jgi:hypothetical protein
MPVAKKHQKLPVKWEDREKLRSKGQFWTPEWVAKPMVQYAIGFGTGNRLLFDPATGAGAFWEAFASLKNPDDLFCGTDIDKVLLQDPIYKNPSCRVEVRDFIQNPPSGSFASIVANPPYIRHHRLSVETKAVLRQIALKNMGSTLDGRAGIHIYFLIQALSLLAPMGRLAFILPADTCEGVFAKKLWAWVSATFRLDAVITFDADATPFPGVDTNAVVFFIQRNKPKDSFYWVRCREPNTPDLFDFVRSGFKKSYQTTLEVTERTVEEGLRTGLSRPLSSVSSPFTLSDFASVMRGVATGANDFFWLTHSEAAKLGIPRTMLKPSIGRTRDIKGESISKTDLTSLDQTGSPTLLFCPDNKPIEQLPQEVQVYLRIGEKDGLHERALIKSRNPWYKMERREIPPFLFAYLGRRNVRFIRNEAGVIPLTGFLCVYPHPCFQNNLRRLWEILNHPETLANLALVGKSYGSGAIKVEPRNLERLPIPEHLALELLPGAIKSDKFGNLLLLEDASKYKTKKKKKFAAKQTTKKKPTVKPSVRRKRRG